MPTFATNTARLLLAESNPLGTNLISSSSEIQAIIEAIKPGEFRHLFKTVPLLDLSRRRLINSVKARNRPTILHFAGHGEDEGITISNGRGGKELLDKSELAGILQTASLDILFLNACHSAHDPESLTTVAKVFIGSSSEVRTSVAMNFAKAFYGALADGLPVQDAAESAALLAVPTGRADGYRIIGDLTFSIGEDNSAPSRDVSESLIHYVETLSQTQMRDARRQLVASCLSGAVSVVALLLGWPKVVQGLDIQSLIGLPVAMIGLLLTTHFGTSSARARATANNLLVVAKLARASLSTASPVQVLEMLKAALAGALRGS